MHEQEKQRVSSLMMLICYTIFVVVLAGESLLLGWDMAAVVVIILALVACWSLHVMGQFPELTRQWIYFIFSMLAFFFYGIHTTSLYDLAPVMTVLILMYSMTELYNAVRLCAGVYYFTMLYDFIFLYEGQVVITPLSLTRTLLHLALVFLAAYLAHAIMHRRAREICEMDQKITELENINRKTEDFLANVSHELRTPTNVVTGITSVMLANEHDAGKRNDLLSVQGAGYRLFGQIEDILDYTEIDTGRIKVSEESYILSSVINDVITEAKMAEIDNNLELIFDVDAKIPSVLIGDARKLKKIIRHLIDNSFRYTEAGGIYVRIFALKKPYGVNLCIRISDTGVGVDESETEKLTDKFYQSDSGKSRRAGGLGLGLSIVQGIVCAMEGFMNIESAPNKGMTVSISIPQKAADLSPLMALENRSALCPVLFVQPEKYEVPEVRNFYNETATHMAQGLEITLHRASDIGELENLISSYSITHLFVGEAEYQNYSDYIENIDSAVTVAVIADDSFEPPQNSRVKCIRKPFCCYSAANLLNGSSLNCAGALDERRIVCPGVNVLIVDDEPMNLMVAEGIFGDYGMHTTTVQSGKAAIEVCERESFDLIFLDHMMPEMDGIETLKRLQKLYANSGRELKAVAFTANAVSGAKEMFLEAGFCEFVSKPIDTLELERVLKHVLPKNRVQYVDEPLPPAPSTQNITQQNKPHTAKPADEASALRQIGLNTQAGLKYCLGDMAFYKRVLLKYANDEAAKSREMKDFYDKGDFNDYQIMVHALKSTSKTIGADELSEMARLLEQAAKAGDADYIKANHEATLSKYSELSKNILETLSENDTGEREKEEHDNE